MSFSENPSNSTLLGNLSTNVANPEKEFRNHWTTTTISSFVIFTLTFLLGVPGNSAVIWVLGFKMKRAVHTVCFLNLAITDLIYCLSLPVQFAFFFRRSYWPELLRMFLHSTIVFNISASVFLLTLLSIFRCVAITCPIWFRQQQRRSRVQVICFVAWGVAFLMCLPILLYQQIFSQFQNFWKVLQIIWAVLIFGFPITFMAVCYLLVARKLHESEFSKSRKSVQLIVTVVATFTICWFPYHLSGIIAVCISPITEIWNKIFFGLASFNSALNPLLYVLIGRDFKMFVRRSLGASLRRAFTDKGQEFEKVTSELTVSTELTTL
ncbi:C3a anaphylatoxin chemotactic receptor-like [Hemitrygon akajei]|uniref:C3a anaphylatoxin chemotactic receptor-like n=1 Tax=Hemitrygon akajei TaxID=2704970 RepID=UPI003BF9B32B